MLRGRARFFAALVFMVALVGLLGLYTIMGEDENGAQGISISVVRPLFTKPEQDNLPWIEQVSKEPRIYVYHNILTPEECAEVVRIGQPHLTESLVVATTAMASTKSDARTSNGVFLGSQFMKKSALLRNMERRIEAFSHVPMVNGEVFYLLRYEEGQQYKPHYDYFSDDDTGRSHQGKSGNRIATVLTYLHTPDDGGETIFPNAQGGPLEVKAKAGDAVLFWDYTPDGKPDPKSLHGGKPVLKGTKWALTKWIRQRSSEYSWRKSLPAAELEQLEKDEFEWLATQART